MTTQSDWFMARRARYKRRDRIKEMVQVVALFVGVFCFTVGLVTITQRFV